MCIYLVKIPEPVQYKIYALALSFDLRCESGTYLVNIPEPVQYKIYALTLPFDLRCESGTYCNYGNVITYYITSLTTTVFDYSDQHL